MQRDEHDGAEASATPATTSADLRAPAEPTHMEDLPTARLVTANALSALARQRGRPVAPVRTAGGQARRLRWGGWFKRSADGGRRTRAIWGGVVALILVAGIAFGALKFLSPTHKVQLYVVKKQPLTTFVGGGGLTYPAQTLNIIYQGSATVEQVNVHVGQVVTPGQALLTLNSASLTAQLQEAFAAYQAAQNYRDSLYASGAAPSLIAQAQSQVATAKGRYDALNAQLNSSTYRNGNIIAPFAGIITAINAVSGSSIRANAVLLTLQDESSVVVRVQLPLSRRGQVQVGQSAEVDPDATPNVTFHGAVTVINPALTNVGSDTCEVWIRVANPDLLLLIGESIYARISVTETLPVVPQRSVVKPNSNSMVFVYAHGRAHARFVIVGVRAPNQLGIESGLTPGEEVILTGKHQLSDNERVVVTSIQR